MLFLGSVLGIILLISLVSVVTLCLMARNKSGCFAPREYLPSTTDEKVPLGRQDDDDDELDAEEDKASGKVRSDEEVQLDSLPD